jgi:methylmalonyl-CoA mutase N-terminal domain/subunit
MDSNYLTRIGFPGEFPFVRGVYPTMYRGRLWTMRQYAGFGTAEDANKRFHYLLKQGGRALSVAFDLPTQLGLDSDDKMACGEVGRVGVAISSHQDIEELFSGIDLGSVSTSMTINATAPILLAFYKSQAERQGADLGKLRGTIQNDILKEFIARGNYIYPPKPSLRLAGNLIAYCEKVLPSWYPISISGYHIREAGATAEQELSFTFANALEYVRHCLAAGLDLSKIAGRLSFFFSVDNDFLEEIAKFRAARRIWSHLLTEHFDLSKSASKELGLKFHAQTGGSTLTAKQPLNNIVRVSLQALAAALGGAQSLHTNSWDEALALPSESSARTALRTQQVIAEESGITDTVDPVGGSYAIEEKTDQLFTEVLAHLKRIDEIGGSCAAIEQNYFQRSIAESAFKHQKEIEAGERVVVGVNSFNDEDSMSKLEVYKPDPTMESRQQKRLQQFRQLRSEAAAQQSVDKLKRAATDKNENLMPAIVTATEAGATLGEISGALQEVFGKYSGGAAL